ncbi:MAG: cupredoxin domain-containing protein [Micropruina sp.]
MAALLVLAAGCAGAPASSPNISSSPLVTPGSATSSSNPTLASSSSAPTTITIELADGKVSPNGSRIDLTKGETFVLDITSDRDDEVHVHGFDKEIEVKAGKRVRVEMVADRTGRYEVESHHPELLIAVLQIR